MRQESSTVDLAGAADLLKVHPRTVIDLVNAGALPAARVGRAYVLLTRDVLAHIVEQIIAQTAKRLEMSGRRVRSHHKGSAQLEPRKTAAAAPLVPRAALVEAVAQAIYDQWKSALGWQPWVPGGNADRQEAARAIAKKAIDTALTHGGTDAR